MTQFNYAKSKTEGENEVLRNFPLATILRPSIVYSVDDNFTTNFMTLLSRLPFFPLYYSGSTRFTPIHCSDLTDTIHHIISNNINSNIIECVGPEEITFKEIIQKLLYHIDKKRLLIPIPLTIAKISASFFELMPNPIITKDQLRLLRYDNVPSAKIKTRTAASNENFDNSVIEKNIKNNRKKSKSKFKSLIIEKDFEPENPKNLEELDDNTCKWPIGHPDEKKFYFCGRSSLKDFSYCKLHLLYAYQPKGKKEDVNVKEEVPEFIEKKIQSA